MDVYQCSAITYSVKFHSLTVPFALYFRMEWMYEKDYSNANLCKTIWLIAGKPYRKEKKKKKIEQSKNDVLLRASRVLQR